MICAETNKRGGFTNLYGIISESPVLSTDPFDKKSSHTVLRQTRGLAFPKNFARAYG